MLNRLIGPISSLPGDGRISQISVTAVYPWILGIQQPTESNMRLEKRHWPLVYHYTKFDAPPVAADNFLEADLVGLKSFLGPNYYLVKPREFIAQGNSTLANLDEGNDIYTAKVADIVASLYKPVEITTTGGDKRSGEVEI
jgi:hypothetical protein